MRWEAGLAEPSIKRLGTFLADLTQDKPPDQIHQEILARLRDPEQELDHRLAGIYLHVKDFVPIWTAIRNGVSLPATSWETVVLPVVVQFSPPQNVKPNLETVTSLFLNARGIRSLEAEPAPEPGPQLPPEPSSLLDEMLGGEVAQDWPLPPPEAVLEGDVVAKPGRRWVPQAAAVAIVAIAAVAVWTGSDNIGGTSFSALPEGQVVGVPSGEPSPSPTPAESPSASPAPAGTPTPTRSSAAPPRIPSAPTGLTGSNIDRNSVTLSWNAPRDANNVAYYKIFQNGAVIVQTTSTTDKAIGLAPGTAYTFAVRAYNRAGQESPPSNSIIVTTAAPAPTTFDVPKSVVYGSSFNVGGTTWPCTDVQILIAGNHVENGKVDSLGSFNTQINVHELSGEPGWVDVINSSTPLHLVPQDWSIVAQCAGGPSRPATLSVVQAAAP